MSEEMSPFAGKRWKLVDDGGHIVGTFLTRIEAETAKEKASGPCRIVECEGGDFSVFDYSPDVAEIT